MKEGKYCRLHFRVKASTQLGQVVGVGGSSTTLGNYDTKKVIKLVTTPDSYPIWYTAEPIVVPRGRQLSYCFCLIEGGIFTSYEASNPRSIFVEKVDILIEETFNPKNLLSDSTTTVGGSTTVDVGEGHERYSSDSSNPYELKPSESTESLASLDSLADRTIYITCYHLPVNVQRIPKNSPTSPSFEVTWNASLISMRGDEAIFQNLNKFWVGTVSISGSGCHTSGGSCEGEGSGAGASTSTSTGVTPNVNNGNLNSSIDQLTREEENELTLILKEMKCIPLFLESDIIRDAYYGYCKQVLWPIFHNVEHLDSIHAVWNIDQCKQHDGGDDDESKNSPNSTTSANTSTSDRNIMNFWDLSREKVYYNAYKQVTQAFGTKLIQLCSHPDDIVWVHDYHLMLLPGILRNNSTSKLKIIFFLHIPFPTSQVFRSLPTALEILNSMCSSDVVGFHTFDYCRHFLHAIRRMLGYRFHSLPGGLLAVTMKDSEFVISMSHVSIEPSQLANTISHTDTQHMIQTLSEKYLNKKVFVGVDNCERLSGLILKLEAYRMFLEDTEVPSKYVLVMYALRPNLRPKDEEYTSRELKRVVDEMNVKYQHPVVEYFEQESMTTNQRIALWTVGDVFLLTSIREGLNFMPLEYIYCHKDLPDPGVVVASEFSTCSALLNGSMKINPFNFRTVADVLHKAIHMSIKEKEGRRKRDLTFVQTHTSARWTNQILSDLATKEALNTSGGDGGRSGTLPWPLAHRKMPALLQVNDVIQESIPLQRIDAVAAYDIALTTKGLTNIGTRVFIFDYGGTIVAYEKVDVYMKQTLHSMSSLPSPEMMCALKRLSEDENNCILINTSLSRKKLGNLFDDFENITIATSSGLVCSWGKNVLTIDERDENNNDDTHSYLGSVASVEEGEEEEEEGEEEEEQQDQIFHSVEGILDPEGSTSTTTPPHASATTSTSSSSPFRHPSTSRSPTSTSRKNLSRDLHRESFSWTRQHHETFHTQRIWDHMDLSIDWDTVKNIAIPIMSKFTTRTNGTCMTPRIPGIGWNFFGADPEWGEKQVGQLKIELETALVNHDVRIALLPGSLDIVPRTFNKGIIISEFLRRIRSIRAGKLPSFILVAGNEPNDNNMFDVSDFSLSLCLFPFSLSLSLISLCLSLSLSLSDALSLPSFRLFTMPSRRVVPRIVSTLAPHLVFMLAKLMTQLLAHMSPQSRLVSCEAPLYLHSLTLGS
jgi:trehalose 6-phosphate synthase/phosphatase